MHANLHVVVRARSSLHIINRTSGNRSKVKLTRRLDPSVILVSVQVPNASKLRTAHHVASTRPSDRGRTPQIVVLAAFRVSSCICRTIHTKTDNFLLGHAQPRSLLTNVHAITTNSTLLSPSIAHHLVRRFTQAASPASIAGHSLSQLASHRHRILILVNRNLTGQRVTTRLRLNRDAIGARIGHVLVGLRLHSQMRTIIFTCRIKLLAPNH